MDFALSPQAQEACDNMWAFMREHVFPAEPVWDAYLAEHGPHATPPVIEELKAEARRRGLWNLFLPQLSGLSNLEYAAVAEISGWSPVIAPEAINCQAPDTGNMETLELFATPEQRERWLDPLLAGTIRSAFAMTEPDVASSDATNITTSIVRDGDEYVVNGRKWWITGVADEHCEIFIVMGKTDPEAATHRQQSMILVPGTPPASRWCATSRSSATRTSTATRRSSSGTPGCRWPISWPRRATASRSPRPGSAPAGSTTRCGRSAWPSAHSR
jgi:acyl-CoA dehydrogenase